MPSQVNRHGNGLQPWLQNIRYPQTASSNDSVLLGVKLVEHQFAIQQLSGDMPPPEPTVLEATTQNDSPPAAVLFYLQNLPITADNLVYATVILLITVLLILTSIITIAVILSSENLRDVCGYYLCSLSVSDLLCGTLITPLSIYAALDPNWEFGGGRSSLLCKLEAYVEVMIWSSVVYMFMWLGVDRHAALNKPSRYEVENTLTRCKCWIIFTWITSLLLSCPILAAEMEARYYPEAFLCVLDWGATRAYSATLAVLVIAPSLISVVYTYKFIFGSFYNPSELEDSQKSLLETDHTFMMTFFVIMSFALSWLPWFALRGYESFFRDELAIHPLHFSLMWLAIFGGCWKLLIYAIMNPDFRKSLAALCGNLCWGLCCASKSDKRRSQYQVLVQQRQRYF